MAVLIKGMELPKRCWNCFLFDKRFEWCNPLRQDVCDTEEDKHPSCPLVEVSEHGRLIAEMLTNEYGYKRCSVCECGLTLFITDKNNILQEPNFCPNCGARFA